MKGIRTALRSLARIPFVEPLRGMDECGSGVFLEALCSYFQPNPVRGRGGVLPSSAIRVYWLLQSGARVRRWDLGPATRKPQRATTNDRGSLTLCEYGTWPIRRFFPSQFGTRGGIVMQPNFTAAGTHWIVGSAAVKFGCMTIPPWVPNCDEKNPLFQRLRVSQLLRGATQQQRGFKFNALDSYQEHSQLPLARGVGPTDQHRTPIMS